VQFLEKVCICYIIGAFDLAPALRLSQIPAESQWKSALLERAYGRWLVGAKGLQIKLALPLALDW
jgi:hypothetical protein